MEILNSLLVIVATINLLFASAIFFHGAKDRVTTSYIFISLFAGVWSLATFFTKIKIGTGGFDLFAPALHLHYIAGYLAYLSFLWFAVHYPPRMQKFVPVLTLTTLTTAILLIFIPGSNYFYLTIRETGTIAERVVFNMPGYWTFVALLTAVFSLGLLLFFKRYLDAFRRGQIQEARGILSAALANFFAGTLGIIFNLILPAWGNFSLFYVNPILVTLALTGFGLYALIKYQVLHIRVIVAEIFTFAIWVILFARTITSPSAEERTVNGIFFILTVLFGFFLIRSVYREVKNREEIERLAEDLREANDKLKELDQRKSEFVSLASHQLRTPLTAIKGYSSMLLEGTYGELVEKVKDPVDKIFQSSNRLVAIVEDFLTISRIEQNRLQYDFQVVDLKKLVSDIFTEMQQTIEKKGLRSSLSIEEGSYNAQIDSGKISQVVGNLINNAIQYTPEGEIQVFLKKGPGNRTYIFSVKDSGVGMTEETIDKLFQKFSRADDASKTSTTGTGLGLYVADNLVKAHKGKIWAESDGAGKGSTFFVELPATE